MITFAKHVKSKNTVLSETDVENARDHDKFRGSSYTKGGKDTMNREQGTLSLFW